MENMKILRVVPTIQAVALLNQNIKFAKKKKKKLNDYVSLGAGTIIGTALIKEESDFIEGFT